MNMMKRFVMLSTMTAIGFGMVVAVNAQEGDATPPNTGSEVQGDMNANTDQSTVGDRTTSQDSTITCPYHENCDGQHNGTAHDGTCKNSNGSHDGTGGTGIRKHDGSGTHEKGQHSNRHGNATSDDAANNLQ